MINIFEAIIKCHPCDDNLPWDQPIIKAEKLEKALQKQLVLGLRPGGERGTGPSW